MNKRGYWILSVVVALAVAGAIVVASNAKANPFPLAVYPAASFPEWFGAPGGCPSSTGLTTPDPKNATAKSIAAVNAGGSALKTLEKVSDRARWPLLADGEQFGILDSTKTLGAPASKSPAANYIKSGCGAKILSLTWTVAEPVTGATYYLLDRHGVYLIWYSNP